MQQLWSRVGTGRTAVATDRVAGAQRALRATGQKQAADHIASSHDIQRAASEPARLCRPVLGSLGLAASRNREAAGRR